MSNAIPRTVEGLNNSSYFYYHNKLFKMLCSIFEFSNLPDNWDESYLKEHLFLDGQVAVVDTIAGVIPLQSGYRGYNYYNQPTDFVINNVMLGNIEGKIGEDGEMIYAQIYNGQYKSIESLITRYATLLAEVDASLQTTLINSRVAHVFYATSAAQAKTMQKMYDDITTGKPAVFIRKNGIEDDATHALFNNVKSSFIGTELLDVKRTIMNEFMTEIGINNANTDKKERLISDEVNANNKELNANITLWYNNISKCIERVNKHFGLAIGFEMNLDAVTEGGNDYGLQPGKYMGIQ